jgi:hypothetical protein
LGINGIGQYLMGFEPTKTGLSDQSSLKPTNADHFLIPVVTTYQRRTGLEPAGGSFACHRCHHHRQFLSFPTDSDFSEADTSE